MFLSMFSFCQVQEFSCFWLVRLGVKVCHLGLGIKVLSDPSTKVHEFRCFWLVKLGLKVFHLGLRYKCAFGSPSAKVGEFSCFRLVKIGLTLSWGAGGGANLHHPHISRRKNAILINFGINTHFHKYFQKTSRKFKKRDDVSRFWAKISKNRSKSGKFLSKKENPVTLSKTVQF